jgi:hypothetical protein
VNSIKRPSEDNNTSRQLTPVMVRLLVAEHTTPHFPWLPLLLQQ